MPILFRNHCLFWQPEGIANFETSLHGIYLGLRMAWDPQQDPAKVIRNLMTLLRPASVQMADYWKFVDEIWVGTPEYSGCGWGHLTVSRPSGCLRCAG